MCFVNGSSAASLAFREWFVAVSVPPPLQGQANKDCDGSLQLLKSQATLHYDLLFEVSARVKISGMHLVLSVAAHPLRHLFSGCLVTSVMVKKSVCSDAPSPDLRKR